MLLVKILLLLSGDVETNPGPPKNRGPPGGTYCLWNIKQHLNIIYKFFNIYYDIRKWVRNFEFCRSSKRANKRRNYGCYERKGVNQFNKDLPQLTLTLLDIKGELEETPPKKI